MKKQFISIILGIVVVTLAMPIRATFYLDDESEARAFAEEVQLWQAIREAMLKAKTDDVALKKGIRLVFFTTLYPDRNITTVQELAHEAGVSNEQLVKALDEMIRETLSAFEKDGEVARPTFVYHYLTMLDIFGFDTLPLIKECLKSKDSRIHSDATSHYNAIMERQRENERTNVIQKTTSESIQAMTTNTVNLSAPVKERPKTIKDQELEIEGQQETKQSYMIVVLCTLFVLGLFATLYFMRKKK